MKIRLFAALAAPLAAFGLAACTVEQTKEGELPEYEVEPARIDVDWDTTTIKTPDIDIIPRDTMRVRDTLPSTPR